VIMCESKQGAHDHSLQGEQMMSVRIPVRLVAELQRYMNPIRCGKYLGDGCYCGQQDDHTPSPGTMLCSECEAANNAV